MWNKTLKLFQDYFKINVYFTCNHGLNTATFTCWLAVISRLCWCCISLKRACSCSWCGCRATRGSTGWECGWGGKWTRCCWDGAIPGGKWFADKCWFMVTSLWRTARAADIRTPTVMTSTVFALLLLTTKTPDT